MLIIRDTVIFKKGKIFCQELYPYRKIQFSRHFQLENSKSTSTREKGICLRSAN